METDELERWGKESQPAGPSGKKKIKRKRAKGYPGTNERLREDPVRSAERCEKKQQGGTRGAIQRGVRQRRELKEKSGKKGAQVIRGKMQTKKKDPKWRGKFTLSTKTNRTDKKNGKEKKRRKEGHRGVK